MYVSAPAQCTQLQGSFNLFLPSRLAGDDKSGLYSVLSYNNQRLILGISGCFAPYLLVTGCSDGTVRFWNCQVTANDDQSDTYEWVEWQMFSKSKTRWNCYHQLHWTRIVRDFVARDPMKVFWLVHSVLWMSLVIPLLWAVHTLGNSRSLTEMDLIKVSTMMTTFR